MCNFGRSCRLERRACVVVNKEAVVCGKVVGERKPASEERLRQLCQCRAAARKDKSIVSDMSYALNYSA